MTENGNMKKTLFLGFQFFFLFSAFVSAQNMVVLMNAQDGNKTIGLISIILINVSLGITSIFTPNIVSKFKSKWVLLISSFGYTFFLASGIIVESSISNQASNISVFVGAILCGIGASTIWVKNFLL